MLNGGVWLKQRECIYVSTFNEEKYMFCADLLVCKSERERMDFNSL